MAIGHTVKLPSEAPELTEGRRVLTLEAQALMQLSQSLGASFLECIELFYAALGRVVVTGMGKSGHVGRKIAATLASTGTPAFFVHPAEANHGDLGMVTTQDVILALSRSGETVELSGIIRYARRYDIPLVAMTQGENSTLARAAQVALVVLPQEQEACPIGLAPTTSTTLMMALGDAIASALLVKRGFSATDFNVFHPGGSLGKKLQTVAEIMHRGEELPLVTRETPLSEALLVMTAKRFGCLGIVDDRGALEGILTDGDLRRHMQPSLFNLKAHQVMTLNPKVIRPGALVAEALAVMHKNKITSLFVIEETPQGNQPQGILHIHDCLRWGN